MLCANGKPFSLPALTTRFLKFLWKIPTKGNASDNQRRLRGFLPKMNEWRFFVGMNHLGLEVDLAFAKLAAGRPRDLEETRCGASWLKKRAARTSNHKIFPPGPRRPCRLASSPTPGASRHRRSDLSNHSNFYPLAYQSDLAGNSTREIRNLPGGLFWSYFKACPQPSPP